MIGVACLLAAAVIAKTEEPRGLAEANKFAARGNQFAQKSSLTRAKVEYEKALKVFPGHLDALYNLAVVCDRLGQKEDALKHYRHYVELRPNDADVWTQIGVIHDEAGRRTQAWAAYEKAIAADSKFARAYHNLGVSLKEDGQFAEAERNLAQFVKLEEEADLPAGDGYYSLGILYLETQRVKDGKLLLQKALDADPSVPHYNNAMGDVYLVEHEPALAITSYNKALEKDAQYAPAHSGLGDAYAQLGQRDKAAAAYRRALELRSDYAIVHFKLGKLFEATDPATAIKHFENYLKSGKNPQFQGEARARVAVLAASQETKKP
jgi:tetratricopeptide (TPR) repeat protein